MPLSSSPSPSCLVVVSSMLPFLTKRNASALGRASSFAPIAHGRVEAEAR